jgi:hypothetical protein
MLKALHYGLAESTMTFPNASLDQLYVAQETLPTAPWLLQRWGVSWHSCLLLHLKASR